MSTVIVLAMHGAPPRDLPAHESAEFFRLHAQLGHAGPEEEAMERRYGHLDAKMRAWPRTRDNDPFYVGSQELAKHLRRASGCEVVVGFNEFCGPTIEEAIDVAVALGGSRIVVLTPMMTRGGEHSEVDIPEGVRRAQERHPNISIVYAWPFDPAEVAKFLAAQVEGLLPQRVRRDAVSPRFEP